LGVFKKVLQPMAYFSGCNGPFTPGEELPMRKLMMIAIAAVGLAVAAVAMPTSAEARFDAGLKAPEAATAQPAQYYGYRRRYYAPRYYAPRYYAPRYYAPRYYAPRRYYY
jgi:hypothetical protein